MNHPYKKILLVLLVFQLSINQSDAQTINQGYTTITSQMTNEDKIQQVYGVHFFDNAPELKDFFINLLENRIQVVPMAQGQSEKYTHLNNVQLLNKINPNLIRDITYNPDNFNPLKYQMDFYSKGTMIYRIDAQYVVVIAPQN